MEFNIDSVFDLLYNGFSRKFLLHCDKSTKKNSNTCLLKISDSYGRYDRLLECCYGLFELSNTRKQCSWIDFLAACVMSFGLVIFILGDNEKSLHIYKATNNEMILYSYSIGFIYVFLALIICGNFLDGFYFFLSIHCKPMVTVYCFLYLAILVLMQY
ncbi:Adenosine 3'-phospho 5'-phosphosulfate transporter [Dirofilaria immitis]